MLEVKGVSYHYPYQPWLFKNIDLTVEPGEIVGLFGYSGSGKSTLAQIISGYKQAHEGTVFVNEQHLSSRGIHPVQLVWQHPEQAINPKWRMHKTLNEAGTIDGGILNKLGIKREWLDRWPSELSGGELQRFCLARVFRDDINYLIADEMTTMLDAITQAQIWHAVTDLAKSRNIGILAISHNIHLLRRISDRIINFNKLGILDTV